MFGQSQLNTSNSLHGNRLLLNLTRSVLNAHLATEFLGFTWDINYCLQVMAYNWVHRLSLRLFAIYLQLMDVSMDVIMALLQTKNGFFPGPQPLVPPRFLGPGFAQILRGGSDVHKGPMVTPLDASEESGGMKDVVKLQDMGTEVYLIGALQMIQGFLYSETHRRFFEYDEGNCMDIR